jgi:membrane associated rhomboid family serine protease
LAILTGAVSVLMVVARNSSVAYIAMEHAFQLSPNRVFHGEIYEILTYALLENPFTPDGQVNIINLVLSVYMLWVFGLQIEQHVGSRTFVGYFFGFAAVGALFALFVSLVFPSARMAYWDGAWVVGTAFTVVYARLNPDNPILIGFLIPVAGRYLVYLTLGILVLESLAMGPVYFLPHFGAFAAAEISMRGLTPRKAYLQFRSWQIERDLRRRARAFTVIPGDKDRDSDDTNHKDYLH